MRGEVAELSSTPSRVYLGSVHSSDEDIMSKLYLGQLRPDITQREIEDAFAKFGPIDNLWIARKPPGFAYLTYAEEKDAAEAMRVMDGADVGGRP